MTNSWLEILLDLAFNQPDYRKTVTLTMQNTAHDDHCRIHEKEMVCEMGTDLPGYLFQCLLAQRK